MATTAFDLIVIGGGSGGLTAAITAGELGARVLLVDRKSLGGDCLHSGCVPSKALIASARLAYKARQAHAYGIDVGEVRVDFAAVMRRVDAIKKTIGRGESPEALARHGVEVAFGGARFLDQHTVLIGVDRKETASHYIIATGSHAMPPEIPGLDEAGFLDHVGLFRLKTLPRRLLVIGGGPIGVEMAQALGRLGSEVALVQRGSRLVPREEEWISEALAKRLQIEGIDLHLSSTPAAVGTDKDKKTVDVVTKAKKITLRCDEILVATGRRSTTGSLGLKAAGIHTNARGIGVDDTLRTSRSHIFAVGDCNGGPQFTHWAEYEARIATRNALFRGSAKRSLSNIPAVTFTDPEIAHVGLSLAEAQKQTPDAHVHETSFSHVDRAICEGACEGAIRVVVDGRDNILGVHIFGFEAGELLPEWVLAMNHQLSLKDVGAAIHAYPTMARANRRVDDERFFCHGVSPWTTRLFGKFKTRHLT